MMRICSALLDACPHFSERAFATSPRRHSLHPTPPPRTLSGRVQVMLGNALVEGEAAEEVHLLRLPPLRLPRLRVVAVEHVAFVLQLLP